MLRNPIPPNHWFTAYNLKEGLYRHRYSDTVIWLENETIYHVAWGSLGRSSAYEITDKSQWYGIPLNDLPLFMTWNHSEWYSKLIKGYKPGKSQEFNRDELLKL